MEKNRVRGKTRKRTKKKASSSFARHPLPSFGHLISVRFRSTLLSLAWLVAAVSVSASGASAQSEGKHAHDFLIFVSVFNNRGFALPGARARVRRAEEKKSRWEALSDRRGEFAVRVPEGSKYELTVDANGFKSETRKIDAREVNRADLSIQMEPLAGGKP
jgi:hypothetical protein